MIRSPAKRSLRPLFVLLLSAVLLAPAVPTSSAPVSGANLLYTLDADFQKGAMMNLNLDTSGQMMVNEVTEPFPFVNIAASGRGTMIRINAETGAIVGEYWTSPNGMGRDPSRTTVDQNGNVWVANRAESGWSGGQNKGSVARIGILLGGTRVDAGGNPDPMGEYVQPPYQYNTCIDRNGDGLIRTSRGLGHKLAWTNTGGADTHGGVSTAADECILNYTRVTGTGTRTVAIDANNDVWVGGLGDRDHEKLSGVTGQPIPGTQFNVGGGGYGGLIDQAGNLWSARNLVRRTPGGAITVFGDTRGNYGLGIDPNTGHIWHSSYGGTGRLYEFDSTGTVIGIYVQPFNAAQGVAVDGAGHVWVAEAFGSRVWHLAPDPADPGAYYSVGLVAGFQGVTGVAVDANGKIWGAEYNGSRASRIDPTGGPLDSRGINHIGQIDLSVPLGAGASPYNYSDMTGFVAIGSTTSQGTWSVVQDGGVAARAWGRIMWNQEAEGYAPEPDSIIVEARAAETEAGLPAQPFVAVQNGVAFDMAGRFIEVRVTLKEKPAGSPVLSDLRIQVGQVAVAVDVRPTSCPNPLKTGDGGMLFVAIVGTPDFEVTQVVPGSVRLEGVRPYRPSLTDVAAPYLPYTGKDESSACITEGPDGYPDLVLQFIVRDVAATLGVVSDGDVRVLRLTGELLDGTPITGEDVVVTVTQ